MASSRPLNIGLVRPLMNRGLGSRLSRFMRLGFKKKTADIGLTYGGLCQTECHGMARCEGGRCAVKEPEQLTKNVTVILGVRLLWWELDAACTYGLRGEGHERGSAIQSPNIEPP